MKSAVLKTTDYKKFITNKLNRSVKERRVKKLMSLMKQKDLHDIDPIITEESENGKLKIIDGHNRFEARKRMEKHVSYIIVVGNGEKISMTDIRTLNNNRDKWSLEDCLYSYCEEGNPDYILFRQFLDIHKFNIGQTLNILSAPGYFGITPRCNTSGPLREFKRGTFKIENINESGDIAKFIKKLGEYYDGYNRGHFVSAIIKCWYNERFDPNKFLSKLKYQSVKLVDCVNTSDYVKLIETLYNYKQSVEDKIRLY